MLVTKDAHWFQISEAGKNCFKLELSALNPLVINNKVKRLQMISIEKIIKSNYKLNIKDFGIPVLSILLNKNKFMVSPSGHIVLYESTNNANKFMIDSRGTIIIFSDYLCSHNYLPSSMILNSPAFYCESQNCILIPSESALTRLEFINISIECMETSITATGKLLDFEKMADKVEFLDYNPNHKKYGSDDVFGAFLHESPPYNKDTPLEFNIKPMLIDTVLYDLDQLIKEELISLNLIFYSYEMGEFLI